MAQIESDDYYLADEGEFAQVLAQIENYNELDDDDTESSDSESSDDTTTSSDDDEAEDAQVGVEEESENVMDFAQIAAAAKPKPMDFSTLLEQQIAAKKA